ncbi:MAG: hypothetical protein HYY67_06785 [Thaumarchaeota archaeon]|nr:hypothetical protein [Nitrososphaerota archaeon]
MSEKILGLASVVSVDSKSCRVTLIQEVVSRLKIKKGDKIAFLLDEKGRIHIRKA